MGRNQQPTGLDQLPEKTDANSDRLFWVMLKAIVPVGMVEPDWEHRIASEHQALACR